MSDTVVAGLLQTLRSELGDAFQVVLREPSVLVLSVERCEIPIRIVVNDAARPSFDATYGAFGPHARRLDEIQEITSTDMLYQGLSGVIAQLIAHGAVLPEFPEPGLLRALRRSRRRSGRAS